MRRSKTVCLLLLLLISAPATAAVPPRALELHHQGLAELENEKPERAEPLYREVVQLVPGETLGYVNLGIALLRQQKYEPALTVIDQGLKRAPDSPDLLTIRAEVLQWQGDLDGALALLARAADGDKDDVETQYAAFQLATNLKSDAAVALAGRTLERLAELRPENVVVLLQLGQRAVADGDRAKASAAFLRIGELLWQAQPIAERALGMVTTALEGDDLSKARVPAVRLENVLKVSPMFRESLRELKTGIQGIPMTHFTSEPPATTFGDPIAVTFAATRLDERPTAGRGVAAGNFDGDDKPDLARLRGGDGAALEVRLASGGFKVSSEHPAAGLDQLLAADLDNDGNLDLLAFGEKKGAAWLGAGDGTFTPAPDALGLAQAGAAGAVVIDFDIEGDLDLVLAGRGAGAADLYLNALQGPLSAVGKKAFAGLALTGSSDVAVSDLDRDGDLDLAIAHQKGVAFLENLRQGQLVDRSAASGLAPASALAAVVAADFDNDGRPDLVGGGQGLSAWRGGDRFTAWRPAGLEATGEVTDLVAFDADNDGRLDLAAAGAGGLVVLRQTVDGGFVKAALDGAPKANTAAAADLDGDGDLDLAVGGPDGLHWLENRGGNKNRWLKLQLRGLNKGNSKNNVLGLGSSIEVRSGLAYQYREADGDVVHIGLGSKEKADVVRVEWTNGVPQNRIAVALNQRIVEEQLLKGSCPFLYAWDGERFAFVTDLLWAAPIGLPVAPGVWAGADPSEIVRIDGVDASDGTVRLRVTEELWEAAFFDHLRLWVVDHPAEVEVASNLRVLPGETLPEVVLASRDVKPVAAAWDGRGQDVTAEVSRRDDVYADGYVKSAYQGLAARPWTFTFDLGEALGSAVRLHLDGWIFPTDASLNLAIAQRDDVAVVLPRLEVETASGWEVLMASMGFPAGKTKTMVVDTPPLPEGSRRLRIVTTQWLHWDRIAWTTSPSDAEAKVVAKLLPDDAELRFRGFSAQARRAPNGPHVFDYHRARLDSPWLDLPGRYTRYGEVGPLLSEPDDLSVILAPGDEIAASWDISELPPPAAGHVRTYFLESHGWDKDADKNTYEGQRLEPLPFRAMSGYPWGDGEAYPDTPAHRVYRREWLTRQVGRE